MPEIRVGIDHNPQKILNPNELAVTTMRELPVLVSEAFSFWGVSPGKIEVKTNKNHGLPPEIRLQITVWVEQIPFSDVNNHWNAIERAMEALRCGIQALQANRKDLTHSRLLRLCVVPTPQTF